MTTRTSREKILGLEKSFWNAMKEKDAKTAQEMTDESYVTGAVQRPGVVPLRSGDRLSDALSAAGGASTSAEIDGLNLARRLRDGEQVVIPEKKRRATAAPPAPVAAGTRVNLNTATEAQLDVLPGIGAAYAKRIVDSRAVDGPFRSTDDLVSRRIVPRATYDKLRDMVMVGP